MPVNTLHASFFFFFQRFNQLFLTTLTGSFLNRTGPPILAGSLLSRTGSSMFLIISYC